ncbi:MAG: histidine biosynthesis protein [Proteobacteria bacterium]|jgi:DNA-binding protein H-NS|nr:MAG: histidine biosynthesis protein [Pseudomonadota bacterium]
MASVNLDKMSLKELLDLEAKLEKAISTARERERAEVRQKIEAIVQNAGFSVSELFGGRSGPGRPAVSKGGKVAAKYVNPDNRSETWSGRGRKPRWLTAKLEKGAKLEDFLVR